MAVELQGELEEFVGKTIWDALGGALVAGVVIQAAPDYDPHIGTLFRGKRHGAFVSISSVVEEQFEEGQSYDNAQSWMRPVSVVVMDGREEVEVNFHAYKLYRFNAMKSVNLKRLPGNFSTDPFSCVLQSKVRPRSPLNPSAWRVDGKYMSAFDVQFKTLESGQLI